MTWVSLTVPDEGGNNDGPHGIFGLKKYGGELKAAWLATCDYRAGI